MMACPVVLMNLVNASSSTYEAFIQGYPVLINPAVRRGTDHEESRRDLLKDFSELELLCYENYLDNKHIPAVTPQDDWLPLLNRIRDNISQFSDSAELTRVLDNWQRVYQVYRSWIGGSGLNQLTLATFWHQLADN